MKLPENRLLAAAQRLRATPPPGTGARLVEKAEARALVDIAYTSIDSPLGKLLAAATRKGLVLLSFPNEPEEAVLEDLAARVSPRILLAPARLDPYRRELDEYFEGKRRQFDLPLDWFLIRGFHRDVLRVTSAIPYGRVLTYTEVAVRAGSPRASRAAGNALGANPIPIIIPCHRVIRTGGALGGYGGGLPVKRQLLGLEGALPA
jgi:methylated-DNA-[protein]-cysteine S-methyltransferase